MRVINKLIANLEYVGIPVQNAPMVEPITERVFYGWWKHASQCLTNFKQECKQKGA
jgi:hypothetical protein